MICLDANYLIGGTSRERPESVHLLRWFDDGEIFCTPAPAWYEFLCGPAQTEDIEAMGDLVGESPDFEEILSDVGKFEGRFNATACA